MAEETFENIEEVRATDGSEKTVGIENLKVLENIDVELTVEVGRTEITIRDLLRLNEGSVVELDRLAGCLLYTSPSPRDATLSRMPSSA